MPTWNVLKWCFGSLTNFSSMLFLVSAIFGGVVWQQFNAQFLFLAMW
jgi:hypothetical protein